MPRFMEASVDLKLNAGTLLPDVDRITAAFQSKMDALNKRASVPLAQRMRDEIDLRTKALAEEHKSDLEKQRLSVATKRRVAEEEATRAADIASMKQHAQARALYNRLMSEPMLPPRMDNLPGRGGMMGAGVRGNNAGLARMQQGSYAIQDLIQVMGAGGSFAQGMNAVANNLGAMATMAGTAKGAIAGVSLTVLAMAASPAWEAIKHELQDWGLMARRAGTEIDGIKARVEAFDRAAGTRSHLARTAAERAAELGEVHRRKASDDDSEAEGAAHGIRDFRRGLQNRKAGMEGEDAEARQIIIDETNKASQLQKEIHAADPVQIAAARQEREQAQTKLRLQGKPIPENLQGPILGTEMSPEQVAEKKAQVAAARKKIADANETLNRNQAERGQIEQGLTRTARDAAAEEAKERAKKKAAFDKHYDHMQEETGNEFSNRRNRIRRDLKEQEQDIEKSGKAGYVSDEDVGTRKDQARRRAYAASRDVDMDERRAQSRFMRGMESAQKGTGSVAAVQERLAEDLDKAQRLFGAPAQAGQLQAAKAQAMETARAENNRIINASRPKGGQFFGLEQYSQHLMSELQGGNPDEKQIVKNTFDAATKLQTVIDNMGKGLGIWAK